jgi:hypothetical protein
MSRRLAGLTALTLVLAACGSGTATTQPTTQPTPATTSGSAPTQGGSEPTDGAFPTGGSEPTPGTTALPDQPLEDMFPDDLGGQPVQVQSAQGATITSLFQGSDAAEINEVLAPFGKTVDDASAAFAIHLIPNPTDPTDIRGATLVALRVQGVPSQDLIARFAQLIAEQQAEAGESPAAIAPATISGKSVTRVTPAGAPEDGHLNLYGIGDVMFMIGGTPALVEEAFAELP